MNDQDFRLIKERLDKFNDSLMLDDAIMLAEVLPDVLKYIDCLETRNSELECVVDSAREVERVFSRSMSMYVKMADFNRDKIEAMDKLMLELEELDKSSNSDLGDE
jgi:hypothetical protein